MQEWCHDFDEDPSDTGCCLNCNDASPGCLCYQCKCTKCFWYSPPHETMSCHGLCELAHQRKEERRRKFVKGECLDCGETLERVKTCHSRYDPHNDYKEYFIICCGKCQKVIWKKQIGESKKEIVKNKRLDEKEDDNNDESD